MSPPDVSRRAGSVNERRELGSLICRVVAHSNTIEAIIGLVIETVLNNWFGPCNNWAIIEPGQ